MGRKKREAENFHEAENMALTSISFGLCAILTILICIPQLKGAGVKWDDCLQRLFGFQVKTHQTALVILQ